MSVTPDRATASSSAAYVRRSRWTRAPFVATAAPPSARPAMKLERTRLVDQMLLPKTRAPRWNQTVS
ncbi:MAG: hypothetical protein DMF89_04655 [Acidobacteria bacterium]|nr:MAG: hypothetical protein DMF89_04655 [Acidobacteriota bacterium]